MSFSWSEILIVGIVALIVVGPEDLPQFLKQCGRFIYNLKQQVVTMRENFFDNNPDYLDIHNLDQPLPSNPSLVESAQPKAKSKPKLKKTTTFSKLSSKPTVIKTSKAKPKPKGKHEKH